MNSAAVKEIVRGLGVKKVNVRKLRNKVSENVRLHVVVPLEENGYEWNEEHRALLNIIAKELGSKGWKWAPDTSIENSLLNRGDDAWTLFNGGIGLTIKH